MMKPDPYKAIRKGAIYCSPRCGKGCTHKEFLTAAEKANELCKQLGPQWEPVVWENLGWHYSAKFATFSVYPSGRGLYWADLNVDGTQYEAHGETPRDAVNNVRGKINAFINKANRALELLPL